MVTVNLDESEVTKGQTRRDIRDAFGSEGTIVNEETPETRVDQTGEGLI